jgi:hypothetical protein
MRNPGVALILSFMVLSNLAYAILADCPACVGKTPDWTSSAIDFLEGKPANNDVPSGLNGPQQARLIDAQIDSKKKSTQPSNGASNSAVPQIYNSTSALDIALNNISAIPNPVNSGDPVKIMAVFGNNSLAAAPNNLSRSTDPAGLTVYADIKNAAGAMVGRVNLKHTSGNEYTGLWGANVGSGTYTATIDASWLQGIKIFDEALRITVKESENTTGSVYAIRKLG